MGKIRIEKLNQQILVNFSKKYISCILQGLTFKQAGHTICYLPALDISGYGDNAEQAREMVDISVDEYFKKLLAQPPRAIKAELRSLGFQPIPRYNKRFETPTVDAAGVLRDFDLDEETVIEESMLQIN